MKQVLSASSSEAASAAIAANAIRPELSGQERTGVRPAGQRGAGGADDEGHRSRPQSARGGLAQPSCPRVGSAYTRVICLTALTFPLTTVALFCCSAER
jgi:hypothetical protein